MTTPVAQVLRMVSDIMQDQTSVRWPLNELVRWLNAAQREILLYRPDALNKMASVSCVVGTKQSIPTDGAKLIDVPRNVAGPAIRLCNREILDAQMPNWHMLTPKSTIAHFMYDEREPLAFWVYPPAVAGTQLSVVYAAQPVAIAEPADGATLDQVTGNVSVADIYVNAVADYIMYRAYSKDADYTGNEQRAGMHYAAFGNSMGAEWKATEATAPRSRGNPNVKPGQVGA